MESVILFVQSNWKDICLGFTSLVTVASIIVKFTPTPKDDALLAKVISILGIISLNKKA